MRIVCLGLFLTLVAYSSSTFAEVHSESAMDEKDLVHSYENIQTPDLRDQNLLIGPIPFEMEQRLKKKRVYYPYRSAIAPRTGIVVDPTLVPDAEAFSFFTGLSYTFPSYYSPKWEVGADLAFNSRAYLHLSRKTIFNENSGFRPFYRLGIGHKLVASERFASLVNVDNYLFRAGLGLEDLLDDPTSIKLEAELAFGVKDILAMFNVGYSWGWL